MQNRSHGAGGICTHPLSDHAYELIRGAILSYDIVSGSRLTMKTLQRQYTLSSSPLRKALNRLVAEGLVDLGDHGAFRAAALLTDDLRDAAGFRLNVEGASRVKSVRGDDDWEAAIVVAFNVPSVSASSVQDGRRCAYEARCSRGRG